MKTTLFAAGFVMTYVTICLAVMRKWVREVNNADRVAEDFTA